MQSLYRFALFRILYSTFQINYAPYGQNSPPQAHRPDKQDIHRKAF